MQLTIGGCRGSYPVAQPNWMRYGGETTSFLIEGAAGERLLVDAGTGVRTLGTRLQRKPGTAQVTLLLTHYHLDHVLGLPALGPLYDRRWTITMAAPDRGPHTVRKVMPRLLHAPFWPLQVKDMAAAVRFKSLPATSDHRPLRIGNLGIRWCPVHHPGGCTAYRIEEGNTAIVIATDLEWARATRAERAALTALCRDPFPASLLIMDGQYSRRTYPRHAGWGHSTWEECIALAKATRVKRLLITHHDPAHDDRTLDGLALQIHRAHPQASLARAAQSFHIA